MTAVRSGVRRFLGRHVGGTALVLIYHRVTDLERDPQLLAVSPEHFDAHMRLLAEDYTPVSLGVLAESLDRKTVPNRAVAVTFDDGYADNLGNAEPVLARYGVPATVFVSSGYVDSGREFWWDDLDRILLSPGTLPERLKIDVESFSFSAELGAAAVYSEADAAAERGWTVLDPPENERQRAYLALCDAMRPLSANVRLQALDALTGAAGVGSQARPSHRQLTAKEVATLDSSPVVEIGGHTVSHQLLSQRSEAEQQDEIASDAASLSRLCGRPMQAFSYPYGGLDDYTDVSVRLAQEAGYRYACSNHPDVVKPWTDAFRLPRQIVRDWSAEEFSHRLEAWFNGAS